jgi:hypothetical protein
VKDYPPPLLELQTDDERLVPELALKYHDQGIIYSECLKALESVLNRVLTDPECIIAFQWGKYGPYPSSQILRGSSDRT